MNAMEIVLLIAGGIIFILSFVVPKRKEEMTDETKEMVKKEIKGLVAEEIGSAKSQIADIVDETVTYSVEKTERSLERISNEKIMAVNEYSDTVLEEINKNHKEVLFLYDMLNDKHQNLKDTVSEAVQVAKEVETTTKEAEKTAASEDVKKTPKVIRETEEIAKEKPVQQETVTSAEEITVPDISFIPNNNDRILELHKQGKSNVAVARELGLGIGEVKLVIDLFETHSKQK